MKMEKGSGNNKRALCMSFINEEGNEMTRKNIQLMIAVELENG